MDYDKLPCVSICMPTWNRNNFKPLILQNIMGINYPKDKLEFVIDDDGEDKFIKNKKEFDFIQNIIKPIKLNYNYKIMKLEVINECPYCYKRFSRSDSLNRHYGRCKIKKKE